MKAVSAQQMGELLVERYGSVQLLKLNRPAAMNALSSELATSLLHAIERASESAEIRSMVIVGEGNRAFCAGADLKERNAMSAEQKWTQSRTLWHVNEALRRSPKVTIAAVQGWCLGGGFELALYCDFRVCADDARFGFPEMTLGAFPGAGGAVMLPRIVGLPAAKRIMFTAQQLDASEALRLGIVDEVTTQDDLRERAFELAREVERTSPLGLAAVKRVLDEGMELPFDEAAALDQSMRRPLDASEDYLEGMRAHAEKRRPVFRGR